MQKPNDRGVALLIALFAMSFLITLAMHIAYETQIEYRVASNQISEMKAHYAAKSAVELSLYRVLLYKQIMAQQGKNIKGNPQLKYMVDMIWNFPFSWPPIIPDDLNPVDKDQMQTVMEETFMDAEYFATIQGQGGKIDINDLGSPFKPLADGVYQSLKQIFQNELDNNDDFKDTYNIRELEEVLDNISDWIDEDKEARKGGLEANAYEQPRDAQVELPPNRPFRTVEELHMVAGMTDEIYQLIAPKITVYGTKGINPNTASDIVLKALDESITDEVVKEVKERVSSIEKGGPFKDEDDFFDFLDRSGARTDNLRRLEFPFYFDTEYNFRIEATGRYLNVRKKIVAVTYDIPNLTDRYVEILAKLSPTPTPTPAGGSGSGSGGSSATPTPTPTPTPGEEKYKVPKGRPNVVHWKES